MKKIVLATAVPVAALAALAIAQRPADALGRYVSALHAAEGLEVTYTYQPLSRPAERFRVVLSKPNLARLDLPDRLIVADGTTITFYNKKDSVFFTRPQTERELLALFNERGLQVWRPFFDSTAFARNHGVRALPSVTRRGTTFQAIRVSLDERGRDDLTLFLDPRDGIVRQADRVTQEGATRMNTILNTLTFSLAKPRQDLFAFAAPEGSRQVSEEELLAGTWLEDLDRAKQLARSLNRPILVNFYATWCGPCQRLKSDVFAAQQFMEAAKGFVLCRIDIDQQPAVARQFAVDSIPRTFFLNSEGEVQVELSGFEPLAQFVARMQAFLGRS